MKQWFSQSWLLSKPVRERRLSCFERVLFRKKYSMLLGIQRLTFRQKSPRLERFRYLRKVSERGTTPLILWKEPL